MAIPIILGLIGIFNSDFYIYTAISFILLGIFQVGVALSYNSNLKENIHFKIYGYCVIIYLFIFFTSSYWWDFMEINDIFIFIVFIIPPPALAINFSIILYQKTKRL
ncbi:MAG TPA: hypothetical protein VF677_00080 [Flavobacterium sp.]